GDAGNLGFFERQVRVGKRTSGNLARDRSSGCGRGADRDQFRLHVVRGLLVQFFDGPSPIGQRVAALPAELRVEVERHVRSGYLAGLPDGPRSFAIIVRMVRGTVPAGG